MGFEDDLKKEAKKAADNYHEKLMRENLRDLMIYVEDIFRDMNAAFDWFYSPKAEFSGKTPYQLCLAGERLEVKKNLFSQEYGASV